MIFAFGGNALFATSLYVVQRTCRAPLFGGRALANFVFWGYQLFIVMAALGLRARHHPVEGIRRAGMVRRPLADDRLGRLPRRLRRHADAGARSRTSTSPTGSTSPSSSPSPCCTSSTTWRSRSRSSAPRATPSGRRRPGCDDAVVVRPQRRRLLPHRRLPRHHVLLRAEAGGAAGLFLPAVDRPLLVADLPLHLGRAAPPALHGAARLGADARHDLLDHAVDAVLGRHDQRPHDAVAAPGTSCAPTRSCACWWSPSPSTACRPSRGR